MPADDTPSSARTCRVRGTPRSSIVFQSASAWHGWLTADSMLTNGLSHSSAIMRELRLGEVGGEVLALGERTDAERVAVRREHGDRFAHVLGRAAVHDGAGARFDLPRALARASRRTPAAEPHHAGLERRERAQRRIQEQQTEDLARERVRFRLLLQALREREQVDDLVAREIGQVEEAFMSGGLVQRQQRVAAAIA